MGWRGEFYRWSNPFELTDEELLWAEDVLVRYITVALELGKKYKCRQNLAGARRQLRRVREELDARKC